MSTKTILLLFLLYFSVEQMSAQQLADSIIPLQVGNKWLYKETYNGTGARPDSGVIISDSTIDGVHYFYKKSFSNPSLVRNQMSKYLIRWDSTDRVVYDFSMQVGDTTWTPGSNSKSYQTLVSVDTVLLWGKLRKRWTILQDLLNAADASTIQEIVEGIGMVYMRITPAGNFDEWFIQGALINGVPYGTLTNVQERNEFIGNSFQLSANYPNPFNPSTTIRYELPERSMVTLKIFDILGREITQLVQGVQEEAGEHSVTFDASNLTNGVYFYRMTAISNGQTFTQTNKMVLLK